MLVPNLPAPSQPASHSNQQISAACGGLPPASVLRLRPPPAPPSVRRTQDEVAAGCYHGVIHRVRRLLRLHPAARCPAGAVEADAAGCGFPDDDAPGKIVFQWASIRLYVWWCTLFKTRTRTIIKTSTCTISEMCVGCVYECVKKTFFLKYSFPSSHLEYY